MAAKKIVHMLITFAIAVS